MHNVLTYSNSCRILSSYIQIIQSPKKPKEFVLGKISNVSDMKFLTNNHNGEVTSTSTAYNLSREGNIAQKSEKGILPNESDIANIIRVAEITSKKDFERRKRMGDNSTDLLGIVRKVEIRPNMNVYLHSRSMLNFAGEVSSAGCLVVGVDGTGGLINFPNTPLDGAIQHIILSIQSSECLLSQQDRDSTTIKFTPATLSERISNRNRASDICSWLQEVRSDTLTAMASCSGRDCATPLKPAVIKMDCALELMTGCITAFRNDDQIDSAARYNGCVIVVILRYEAQVVGASPDEVRRYAKEAYNKILCVSPCIFKQCNSHVHRAIVAWAKTKLDKKPACLRLWKNQFEQIFHYIADIVSAHVNLSDLIARIAVVITMLRTETIACGKFYRNSDTNVHHPRWQSQDVASKMDKIIRDESEKLRIQTEQEVTDYLERICSRDSDSITFDGRNYAQRVVDRMMGVGNDPAMKFAVTHLKSVNGTKGMGTVACLYVIAPYDEDEEGEEIVKPKYVGGVEVDVKLPHTSNEVRNPLYCPEAAEYVMEYWLNRMGLCSQASISIANAALSTSAFASNQSLEGRICWEKHSVSTVHQDMSCLASLIHRRYEDMVGVGRLVCNEISKAEGGLSRQKSDTNVQQPESEESEMQWKRTSGTTRLQLQVYRDKMFAALEVGKANGSFEYEKKNVASMWRVLDAYANAHGMSFMSVHVFRSFVNMKRNRLLTKDWASVIDHFIEEYV